MKKISTIISIYFLALAILPCADEAGWCLFDLEDVFGVELHETTDHSHEKECGDHCSPFCVCSCCQMTVRLPVKASFELTIRIPVLSTPNSLTSSLSDLTSLNDIWQPPKFS
jgi:hypothetical protein